MNWRKGTSVAVLVILLGCGGSGKFDSTALFKATAGKTWVYKLTGTVALPAGQGGGTHSLAPSSTLTISTTASTVTDASGGAVSQMDRVFAVTLADTRTLNSTLRLYYTQSAAGIFVHGFNDFMNNGYNPVNDKMVPSGASPPNAFLYLPDPATFGFQQSYTNPFSIAGAGDHSYSFSISTQALQKILVQGGQFHVQVAELKENWHNMLLTNVGFAPTAGVIVAAIDATLPDGSRIQGGIELKHAP